MFRAVPHSSAGTARGPLGAGPNLKAGLKSSFSALWLGDVKQGTDLLWAFPHVCAPLRAVLSPGELHQAVTFHPGSAGPPLPQEPARRGDGPSSGASAAVSQRWGRESS